MTLHGSAECERIIQLPKIFDRRGNLSFIEGGEHIPFTIKRTYWIYDVPGDAERDGNALRSQEMFVVALSGSFDIVTDDGREERRYTLNRSYNGLYIPAMLWKKLENFSTNSVAMILSSKEYDAGDYIRDYEIYKKLRSDGGR